MKRTLIFASIAGLGLASAAAAAQFDEVDADGDGLVSLAELQAAAPDATAEDFATYDYDSDGGLNESEFAVWSASHSEDRSGY